MNRYTQYMYSYPHKTAYRPLTGISLEDYASLLAGKGHGLYLHLPFCESKCGYCNLFSAAGQDEAAADAYLQAVKRQLKQYEQVLLSRHTEFSDFTMGGGTPLFLTDTQLNQVFSMVRSHLALEPGASIVIETAPNQTTWSKLMLLKEAGVTRVSMGIQSFSDQELKTLGRSHSASKARQALKLLMEAGFSCVNVDFIYGIPGQTVPSLLASLQEAVSFEPDELFLYPLYVKHGVRLEQELANGMVLNQELAFLQYQEASAFLKSKGYRQDSMRRFVRQKATVREFGDCGFGTSLSLGCGGRSYLGRLHFCTPYATTRSGVLAELERFLSRLDHTAITHGILLSDDEIRRRYVIRHLLIRPGLKKEEYQQQFHASPTEDFPLLLSWMKQGYLTDTGACLSLTDEGLGWSDYLGPQLISPEIRAKMEEWEVDHGKKDHLLSGQLKKL